MYRGIVCFETLRPSEHFLAMSGWRQIKCLAQGQVTVTPPEVKLELGTF